jgi:hypothetical protein
VGRTRDAAFNLIERYGGGPDGELVTDLAAWFAANRSALDRACGFSKDQGPAIVAILRELEADPESTADMGGVNRWPELSGASHERYVALWTRSCGEIGLSAKLPERLLSGN